MIGRTYFHNPGYTKSDADLDDLYGVEVSDRPRVDRERIEPVSDGWSWVETKVTVTHPDGREFVFLDGADLNDEDAIDMAADFFASGLSLDDYTAQEAEKEIAGEAESGREDESNLLDLALYQIAHALDIIGDGTLPASSRLFNVSAVLTDARDDINMARAYRSVQ